jgi:hypothetical protein
MISTRRKRFYARQRCIGSSISRSSIAKPLGHVVALVEARSQQSLFSTNLVRSGRSQIRDFPLCGSDGLGLWFRPDGDAFGAYDLDIRDVPMKANTDRR